MSTNRAKCMFAVRDGSEGHRSIIVMLRDNIPALSGKTLSFDLDPDATPEQAHTLPASWIAWLPTHRTYGLG
jgi:hypothetical protein